MDIRKIRKLIDLIHETGVMEIELSETNDKGKQESVRISRSPQTSPTVASTPAPAPTAAPATPAATTTVPEPAATSGHTVNSPMVGTAYLAATPGQAPFVSIGQSVKQGDTLCVIEAMKMFNQITADVSGTISARLIENEQAVEFDQPLFIIDE